ncbi:hypothetical protein EW14_1260 [Prochlorococcus sp. MIT 0604]|nr:hypothetical protein EW14_1260 [Prochlorococcus sp. MIT 0604]
MKFALKTIFKNKRPTLAAGLLFYCVGFLNLTSYLEAERCFQH